MGSHVRRRTSAIAIGLALTFTAPALAGPSPVGLGGAGAYAVLAGSGMTNTGVSTIDGDVGSSPKHSQTGFGPCPAADCVSLTGANHDVADPNDAVTQQAKSDLVVAYDDAFGRTGGTAVTAPLGAGQTLVAGVYTSAADLFVGGDLTLDGGGDAGSVFIFQARTGTLVTAAGSTAGVPNTRVLLTNGAQACNVFWQVGSSATLGTSTQFAGTILALQSIAVGTGATIEAGRLLARNGAVTLDANVVRAARCATPAPASSATTTPPAGTETTPPPATARPAPSAPSTPLGAGVEPRAAKAPRGTARISAPRSPTGRFSVSVTGRQIRSVTYFLDGRRVRTVRGGRFAIRLDARRHSGRVHRITARVRFTASSGTRTVRLRTTFRRRAGSITTPRYAG